MKAGILVGTAAIVLVASGLAIAHVHPDQLPAGPIRDRHVLMDDVVGKNAKIIGDAMKSGKYDGVGAAAEKIHEAAGKIPALFPKGSTHELSRAKPEIWTDWDKFEGISKGLEITSGELAAAAKVGNGIPDAASKMFGTCKACHDQFRIPEKKHED